MTKLRGAYRNCENAQENSSITHVSGTHVQNLMANTLKTFYNLLTNMYSRGFYSFFNILYIIIPKVVEG